MPTTNGHPYSQYFFQTDVALSESTCDPSTPAGCTVPPTGPGGFYPFWSVTSSWGGCALEFGNVTQGNVKTFGGDAQYGTNQLATLGYPEFIGPLHSVAHCSDGQGYQ